MCIRDSAVRGPSRPRCSPASGRSEDDVRSEREGGTALAGGVVAEIGAGRTLLHSNQVRVDAPAAYPGGPEAHAAGNLPRVAIEVVEHPPVGAVPVSYTHLRAH